MVWDGLGWPGMGLGCLVTACSGQTVHDFAGPKWWLGTQVGATPQFSLDLEVRPDTASWAERLPTSDMKIG